MAISISTERWEMARKVRPSGAHFWQFQCVHPTKGSHMVSTDGQYPKARDYALARFRKAFGVRSELVGELLP